MADKQVKYVNQAIKDEHDNSTGPARKRVQIWGWDPVNLVPVKVPTGPLGDMKTSSQSMAMKITDSGSSTYFAWADPGSTQASAVWKAMKMDEATGNVITWADGDSNFNNVATDLTTLSYS